MIEQRSPEWFAQRCGKVTGSRVADVVAKTKSGWGASRANYMAQIIAERLTGTVADSFSNAAMQWGTETEPQAIAAYEFFTDNTVDAVGFVDHQLLDAGASPDGLIGELGLIEVKCPNTATHINTLLTKKIEGKYITQMQWQLACTDRNWCDFVSFDPRMPAAMQMFCQRVERDNARIRELTEAIETFLAEMQEKVSKLQELYEVKEAA